MHTPRPASAPELRDTTPGRGGDSPSVASARGLGIQADGQYQLFTAIKERNVDRVKFELSRMESARDTQKATLLHASKRVEFRCQSPLMAAAASGEVEMFTVVLDAWRTVCRSADCSAQADLVRPDIPSCHSFVSLVFGWMARLRLGVEYALNLPELATHLWLRYSAVTRPIRACSPPFF